MPIPMITGTMDGDPMAGTHGTHGILAMDGALTGITKKEASKREMSVKGAETETG